MRSLRDHEFLYLCGLRLYLAVMTLLTGIDAQLAPAIGSPSLHGFFTEMKKAIVSIAVLSALGFSTISQAAPAIGGSGTLSFNGGLSTTSCWLTNGAGGTGTNGNWAYNMGPISASTLGTQDSPRANGATGLDFTLALICDGLQPHVQLTPTVLSGKGIGLNGGTGSAENVQITLWQRPNPVVLDFSTAGSVNMWTTNNRLELTAYYTLKPGKTISDVKGGTANASMAYVVTYN